MCAACVGPISSAASHPRSRMPATRRSRRGAMVASERVAAVASTRPAPRIGIDLRRRGECYLDGQAPSSGYPRRSHERPPSPPRRPTLPDLGAAEASERHRASVRRGRRVGRARRPFARATRAARSRERGPRPRSPSTCATRRPWPSVGEAHAALGGLDGVVNAAAIDTGWAKAGDMSLEIWDDTISTNLSGTYYVCRAALPVMGEGRRSSTSPRSPGSARGPRMPPTTRPRPAWSC